MVIDKIVGASSQRIEQRGNQKLKRMISIGLKLLITAYQNTQYMKIWIPQHSIVWIFKFLKIQLLLIFNLNIRSNVWIQILVPRVTREQGKRFKEQICRWNPQSCIKYSTIWIFEYLHIQLVRYLNWQIFTVPRVTREQGKRFKEQFCRWNPRRKMPETLAVKFLWRCFMCRPNLFKWLAGNNAKHSLCQFCLWPNDLKSGRLNISASSWINNKQEDLIQ